MRNIEILSNPIKISLANGETIIAKKKGTVEVSDIESGKPITFTALIAPKLSVNLLSVRQLTNGGSSVTISENRAFISNKAKDFSMQCCLTGRLYVVNFASPVACNAAST